MLTGLMRTAAIAGTTLVLGGCALTGPVTYGLDPGAAALVRQTCSEIMGLSVVVAEYDACGTSLADSVRILNDAHLTSLASEQCEQQGLRHGTAALAKCVVVTRRGELSTARLDFTPTPASETPGHRSYLSMSRAQQLEREELSCAHLGLHPASGAFKQCVVSLRDSILAAQYPL